MKLKICQKCILPETFPGIKFNENGICNHCLRDEKSAFSLPEKKQKYREKLDALIEETKGRAPVYDAIMAFSGGKDSTYTMKLLKERYGIRILALTFDNHFVSPEAWRNINNATEALGVDHINFRLPWKAAKGIFTATAKEDVFSPATLLRASSICTACIGIVKSIVLKTSLEMSIPLVAFGWSPGQAPIQSAIMKTNPDMTRQTQSAFFKAFDTRNVIHRYLIPEIYYDIYKDRFPVNIHPLAFFDYNEEDIKRKLGDIGWKDPKDTDTNSSNCLLNAFANQCHIERHGFHPYVWEIANMVRHGIIQREEGIEKIYSDQNSEMVEYARGRLGYE